jgi:hypothetical protein
MDLKKLFRETSYKYIDIVIINELASFCNILKCDNEFLNKVFELVKDTYTSFDNEFLGYSIKAIVSGLYWFEEDNLETVDTINYKQLLDFIKKNEKQVMACLDY